MTPPDPAMTLQEQLQAAENRAAQLRLQIAQGPCIATGHSWEFLGGRNAGCGDDCNCSVPVHHCKKCGDCDYGDNAEAAEIIKECAESRP
jgi:predicted alpha/beta-hydrolase family hydrolase